MRSAWPVVTFAALAVLGCKRTSDPVSTAKSFFDQLAANETRAAFRSSASVFQAQQSEREFAASAQDWGFVGAEPVRLDPPEFGQRTAKVPIEITPSNSPALRLIVTLCRESGVWRVCGVRTPVNLETGLSANSFTRIGKGRGLDRRVEGPMPDEQTIQAMARETLLQFHDAIHQKSFEDFYGNVSRAWQEQLTLGMLTRTFQSFIDQQPDLTAIRDVDVDFDAPPRINSQGLLIVSGSYPTKPLRVAFSLTYYYDLPDWRVFVSVIPGWLACTYYYDLPDWRVFGLKVNLYK
ncbi:MAG TPA: hypothetical protein VFD27_22225 [Chthoniobacteraceae bacterium]|nr:hypothetical protein [Chthoniobacteraceae bacterium]